MFELDLSIGVQLIAALIFTGGAGYLAYKAMGKVQEKYDLQPDTSRVVAWGLTMLIAWVAYGLLVWLGAYEQPGTEQDWFLTLLAVAFVAITSSQGFHAKNELRARRT
jgi:hypothetical protein